MLLEAASMLQTFVAIVLGAVYKYISAERHAPPCVPVFGWSSTGAGGRTPASRPHLVVWSSSTGTIAGMFELRGVRVGLIRLRWVGVTMDYREVAQWAG